MALAVACEMHPLQNLRVLGYLQNTLHHSEAETQAWSRHWVTEGLIALEQMVKSVPQRGAFCFGNAPTMADLCLIPQMVNARRFGCDLSACPTLVQIDAHCCTLPAFTQAAPEAQPDAEN
jgi:maleylpyruvate isomerase